MTQVWQNIVSHFKSTPTAPAVISPPPTATQLQEDSHPLWEEDIKLAHLQSEEEATYIHIEPSLFPVLPSGPKPHYTVYKAQREQYLNMACQAVEKYLALAFEIEFHEKSTFSVTHHLSISPKYRLS